MGKIEPALHNRKTTSMRNGISTTAPGSGRSIALPSILLIAGLAIATVVVWQTTSSSGEFNPLAAGTDQSAAIVDILVLVFREGLECVLVLAALTAGMRGSEPESRNPIAIGVGAGFIATLFTWVAAVHVLNDLSQSVSALALQAATGLIAVIVLLVVMNWFFHKVYWTGWISFHTRRKRELLSGESVEPTSRRGLFWGMTLLGFTSLYREGFEVVLFLQSYRLRLGNETVLFGALAGIVLTGIVAVLTFVAHRRLPYRKMLIATGVLLGLVLIVMVGEQVQEMQLAGWLPTTNVPWLASVIPQWMGLWFSIFPTVQTLAGQAIAVALVLGSYFIGSRPERSPR